MEINKIKKAAISKIYTKEDINLSEYIYNKAIKTLKDAEIKKDSNGFYQAIDLFEKSIITYPKQSKAYIALSFLFWKINEHENAIILLKKAREFDSFNINIPKQIKIINDDYIKIQKDKIIKKNSENLFDDVVESKKSIISESIDTMKSVFTKKISSPSIKNNTSTSIDMNTINDFKKVSNLNISEGAVALKRSENNSNKNMMEALAQLKSQRENIKIKTAKEFLSKFK